MQIKKPDAASAILHIYQGHGKLGECDECMQTRMALDGAGCVTSGVGDVDFLIRQAMPCRFWLRNNFVRKSLLKHKMCENQWKTYIFWV